ncbi:MAG TPA: hypothetical protein VGO93_21115 [Candidatus Xenobia bacterium]|jgi:hypothetical protein
MVTGLTVGRTPSLPLVPTRESREREWQDREQQVDGTQDALGLGLDPGIKFAVVGLQANGFHTVQSCEGHSNRGCGAPWVDIEAPGVPKALFEGFPNKLFYIRTYNQEEAAFRQVAQAHGLTAEALMDRGNGDTTGDLRQEALVLAAKNGETPEYQAWVGRNHSVRGTLEHLLSDYQAAHPGSEDGQPHLEIWGPEKVRLYTGTQADLDSHTWEMGAAERASLEQRLPRSRRAMNDFADYLKDRFVSAGPYVKD